MKKLYINTGGFDAVFNDLKENFSGTLTTRSNEYKLDIQSKWTKGSIKGTRFDDKVLFMHFDLEFHQEVSLSIESNHNSPVFFVYCENGNVSHSFGANGDRKMLSKNQSAVLNNSSVINSVLYFESHKRIQFTLLGMPTMESKNTELVSQIRQRFTNDSGNYIYVGKGNPKINEKLQEYNAVPNKGNKGALLRKNILNNIVEMEIEQHSFNYLKTFTPVINIARKQIDEIKKLSTMNFAEVVAAAGYAGRNLPKLLKSKYHWTLKPYNQKLAS
ncbi:hypothetical protein [Flavobacterium sp.]|uniref:hypothetical protein n=1 Tax=Flavobacterium sp. TaxID=239 RepID=UPI0031DB25FE